MVSLHSVLFAALAGLAAGQYEGWDLEKGQVSASMCYWSVPRAAVIRDTLWLDGGTLVWTSKYANGENGQISSLNNPLGLMYSFNFSKPFDLDTNITKLIETMSKAPGGSGNVNSFAPNMMDGALLYNDAEFFLYGGVLNKRTAAYEPPPGDKAVLWRFYDYGEEKPLFQNGSDQKTLGDDITRYVAHGGAASAPSENKAWYVGGMRSPLWGEIYLSDSNRSRTPANTSNTLITLDMTQQLDEKFSNKTLPPDIKPRANPSVVWVPVGSQGILVAVGGVTYPEFVNNAAHKSDNEALSKSESPEFMEVIDIYDVASDKWYQQKTEGSAPPALTRGCAVLATAQDYSSFNIYYYGGYNGIDPKDDFNDDVWVLSIPSFQWIKVHEGEALHARAGHQCVTPYPDQMLVIGGYTPMPGAGNPPCLDKGIFRMFNLSSAEWMDGYSPSKWSNYTVPTAVRAKIGGNEKGSATATTPVPSGWSDRSLQSVFATPYATSKINTWYPYTESKETDRPVVGGGDGDGGGGGSGGTPKWVAPVLGVVLGLVFITAILVGFCLWRRRKIIRRGNATASATDDNGSRIISWIRGQPSEPAKAPTVTTEEASTQDMAEVRTPPPAPAAVPAPFVAHEMADNHIAELPDTSPRAELHGVGLTPVEIINKHTHFGTGSQPGTTHQSSYYASVSSNENASSLSRSSGVLGYQTRAQSPSPEPMPSPPIGASSPRTARVGSDVSGLSEQDARHLRHISQATVSSASSGGEQEPSGAQQGGRGVPETVPETPTPGHPSPLSPPTGASDGEDYITAKMLPVSPAGTGTLRRSMFHESEDDLGAKK